MNPNMNLKTKLFELLSNDKLGQAIDFLMEKVKSSDPDYYNTLILLKSRYASNEKDSMLGLLSRSDYNRSKNQITYSFQQTLEKIPPEILEDTESESQNKNSTNENISTQKEIEGYRLQLATLKDKLFFLNKEYITSYDSEKKFALSQQINEIEERIAQIEEKISDESSKEELEWESLNSNAKSTYDDYHNFLKKYPDTRYRESAIEKCKISDPEKTFWDMVNLYYRDNPDEYYNYLKTYPLGKYSGVARSRLQYLEDIFWSEVKDKNNIEDYTNYLKIYSNGKYINEATKNIADLKEQHGISESKIIDGISDKNVKQYIAINIEKSGIFVLKQQKVSFSIKNISNEFILKNLLIEISGSADHSINDDNIYKELFDLNIDESKTIELQVLSRITGPVRIDIKICGEFYSPTVYLYAVQDNPYFYGKPIEDEDNFFGRKTEINIIKSDIEGLKAPRFIVGEQRSGKSSILLQIKNYLLKSDFIPLYLSLEHRPENEDVFNKIFSVFGKRTVKTDAITSLRWLLYEMLVKMNEISKLNLDIDNYLKFNYPADFLHNLKLLISDIQKNKPRAKICLLLDEGNELINIEEKFQSVLRATLNELSRDFTVLIACSNEFMEFVQNTKSSPFKNIFSYTLLRPFSGLALQNLIKIPALRFSVEFSDDAINKIAGFTGGHPFYVQALCSKCFDIIRSKNEQKIQSDHVDKAYAEIIHSPEFKDKFIMGYWDLFKRNKEFIEALKAIMNKKSTSTIKNYTFIRLENRSLIISENNTYRISSELFNFWLKTLI